jgi:hypothetical protein
MYLPDRVSQSIGRLWDRDHMHVIGHQAVGPDLDVLSAAERGYQFQVALVILVTEEALLPAVPPLSDLMRQTRCNNARQSSHHSELQPHPAPVKN